jgi:hypothetical protein
MSPRPSCFYGWVRGNSVRQLLHSNKVKPLRKLLMSILTSEEIRGRGYEAVCEFVRLCA